MTALRNPCRVLIADDDDFIRQSMAEFVRLIGYDVVAAVGDGKEAVTTYLQKHADILLMDYDMPELNGFEAARLIRLVNPDIPLIICSGSLESDHLDALTDIPDAIYLMKPASLDQIRHALAKAAHQCKSLALTP